MTRQAVAAGVSALALLTGAPALAEIKIGASLAVTGPAAFLGDPEAKTLEMLVEELNANGGINGEEVELVLYDDGADPNKARTFATRLIEEDEVVAVIGGSSTGTTMAMAPLFADYEIPFISLAGAVVIIDPVQEFVFKTPHTDRMACEKIFADITSRGMTKVGLISGTGGFGASMREQCLDVAESSGVEIVADESYGGSDSDMTPQLTNIASTDGIEAIVNPGFGQGPAVVTRNYAQLGLDMPLYQSHGVASDEFIKLAGDAANGIRLPATPLLIPDQLAEDDVQRQPVQDYIAAYEEAYGEKPSTFGGYAYDAFHLLVDAIERAGSTDPVEIRDALEATEELAGVTGVYTFSPEDHMGLDLSAFRILEIEDGGWKPVEE
ncbi:ABC transporter substrate-binding protein [Limimaricola cinnabarinus]|jgi:branched-chain amino acid transport system substrate-binding protein|uniref:ABC transporter substrate-binding protein n=1 Tax=Limimaricola cinnabarinus TaxID=1125964 RepID=A0A2G1MDB6_9RHOB|nr:ABC transporter substrate-binding protein [Limimaricola cinnabarinus]PHP26660.1 ABC transporter substrate-binding protein [Limimaricola cinnabarinus]